MAKEKETATFKDAQNSGDGGVILTFTSKKLGQDFVLALSRDNRVKVEGEATHAEMGHALQQTKRYVNIIASTQKRLDALKNPKPREAKPRPAQGGTQTAQPAAPRAASRR